NSKIHFSDHDPARAVSQKSVARLRPQMPGAARIREALAFVGAASADVRAVAAERKRRPKPPLRNAGRSLTTADRPDRRGLFGFPKIPENSRSPAIVSTSRRN